MQTRGLKGVASNENGVFWISYRGSCCRRNRTRITNGSYDQQKKAISQNAEECTSIII